MAARKWQVFNVEKQLNFYCFNKIKRLVKFSGLSSKTVNCQGKITCCILYTSSEKPNLFQFKNIYPVVKLPSAFFKKTISSKPCSGSRRYCGGRSNTEKHQHCKTDEWSAGWGGTLQHQDAGCDNVTLSVVCQARYRSSSLMWNTYTVTATRDSVCNRCPGRTVPAHRLIVHRK